MIIAVIFFIAAIFNFIVSSILYDIIKIFKKNNKKTLFIHLFLLFNIISFVVDLYYVFYFLSQITP